MMAGKSVCVMGGGGGAMEGLLVPWEGEGGREAETPASGSRTETPSTGLRHPSFNYCRI